jgi:uncharacterized protein with HEPN domain
MPPTLADRVRHILEAIADIETALSAATYEDFKTDRMRRLAIERLLEIICEATRHVPAEVKAQETQIPWRKVTNFGNQLRHAYDNIDPDIVWRVVHEDLGALKAFVERVIREAEK